MVIIILFHYTIKHFFLIRNNIIALITISFVSCGPNWHEAMLVSKNFKGEYTGLDTLINLSGYYYKEDSIRFNYEDSASLKIAPLFFSRNGEFKMYGYFKTREALLSAISLRSYNGYYTIVGDTIKVKWVSRYNLNNYDIFSGKYFIENDTTIRHIWFSCETCETKRDPVRNEIYRFFKYQIDTK